MGFFKLLLIFILIYTGYKILRFSLMLMMAKSKFNASNKTPKHGETSVHYVPEKKTNLNLSKEDDYINFEEVN